jgi:hypothetical protein
MKYVRQNKELCYIILYYISLYHYSLLLKNPIEGGVL